METVIFIKALDRHPDNRKLAGASEAASRLGWRIQVSNPVSTKAEILELEKFWNPVGYIVASGISKGAMPVSLFGGKPAVFFYMPDDGHPASRCICEDHGAAAQLAAKELLGLGLPRYGYVCDFGRPAWSEPRLEAFSAAMELHGQKPDSFDPTDFAGDSAAFTAGVSSWLRSGPLPLGVFAVNDSIASMIAAACTAAGLRIPDDVAIIGVSNDAAFCEGQVATLSSVALNYAGGGRLAVEKLARLVAGKREKGLSVYPPLWVVRRASTTRFAKPDEAVAQALERIRREACGGLTARDVLKDFGCSRRSAEMRFRAAAGRSILGEIRRVRLETAKELLEDGGMKIDDIAYRCGYASSAAFSIFFRAETGLSPSRWRGQRR